ncbi:MAG: SCO family protein [Xanthomonadales bacterium]|nr:SCO family protein [Xanthomonadales bacterium]
MSSSDQKRVFINPVTIVFAAAFAAAGAAAGAWLLKKPEADAPALQAALLYPEPRVLADFALQDAEGANFDLQRFTEQWDLVFFGFTHCPDICPNTMNELKAVQQLLQESESAPRVNVTFISVDPERDSPRHLATYVNYFDPGFQAATGPEAQLRALTYQMGVLYDIEEHEPGDMSYQVDHSASILVIDPAGRLAGQFPAPHDPVAIAADLIQLIDQRS